MQGAQGGYENEDMERSTIVRPGVDTYPLLSINRRLRYHVMHVFVARGAIVCIELMSTAIPLSLLSFFVTPHPGSQSLRYLLLPSPVRFAAHINCAGVSHAFTSGIQPDMLVETRILFGLVDAIIYYVERGSFIICSNTVVWHTKASYVDISHI